MPARTTATPHGPGSKAQAQAQARFVTGGDWCLPLAASGVPSAPFVDQSAGKGVAYGTGVVPGKWGFVTSCTTAERACQERAAVPSTLPPGSSALPVFSRLTGAETAALLGPGAVPMLPCGALDYAERTVCRIGPESAYYGMNAFGEPKAERALRTRACCLKEGAVFDPSNGAMQSGCTPHACAGTATCRAFAADTWCRELSASGEPAGAAGPPNGAADDALCRALGTWGDDGKRVYDDVMLGVCFDDGVEPSRWFRQPGCLRWCRENFDRCKAAGLQRFCDAHFRSDAPPGEYDVPAYNDICACAYGPQVYDRYFRFMTDEYNIPPALLDRRPMCSFPGCSASLIPDAASVDPAQGGTACPAVNLNVCSQRITVDNKGTIGDVEITASCEQYVVPNDGAPCNASPDAGERTCPTSQACDVITARCRPPENASTPCRGSAACADGWACGASGVCVPGQPGERPAWELVLIVACSVAGACVLAALAYAASVRWRRRSKSGAGQA